MILRNTRNATLLYSVVTFRSGQDHLLCNGKTYFCCLISPEKHVIPHQDFLTVCCKGLILLVLKPICVKLCFTFSYRVPYLSKTIWWHFPTMVMMPNSASWMVISILPSEASVGATLYWIEKSFSLRGKSAPKHWERKMHLNISTYKSIQIWGFLKWALRFQYYLTYKSIQFKVFLLLSWTQRVLPRD